MRPVHRRIASLLALSLMLSSTISPAFCAKSTPWDIHMTAGKQQMASGDYAQASQELEDALKDTARFQDNDPRLGDTYYNLGELRLRQQQWPEAKQYFERALAMQQQSLPPESLAIGDTLYGLATACEQVGNHQMAVILLKRVKDIWTRQYGPNDARLTSILPSMATYATLASDYKTAQDCYRQLVAIQEKTLGANNPRLASSMNLLAGALANTGNFAEAEPMADRAVQILLDSNDSTLGFDSAAANLYCIQQRLGKTATLIERPGNGTYVEPTPVQQQAPVEAKAPPVTKQVQAEVAVQPSVPKPQVKPIESRVAVQPSPPKSKVKPVEPKVATHAVEPTVAKPDKNLPVTIAVKAPKVLTPGEHDDTIVTRSPSVSQVKLPNLNPETILETKPATPVETITATPTKPVDAMAPPPPTKPIEAAATPTKPIETASTPSKQIEVPLQIATPKEHKTQLVMRVPSATMVTTSDEFHPWELANETHQQTPGRSTESTSFGKIRYLANGRLISQEEYKAMLLANEAYELIRTEKYKMAVEVLQRALTMYPDLASGHTNLGLALSQLGEKKQAVEHLRQAIAIDPTRSSPWLNLASAFQMEGDLKASVATYSEFVKRFPKDPVTPKASDILAHLSRELKLQTEVQQALLASGGGKSDYFAYASHTGAVRWPADKTTIKVFVSSGNVPGFKPEYTGFFADSFKQWAVACNNKVTFDFVKSPGASDIECMWTDDISKVSSPAEGGETKVITGGSQINHATITVLTNGPSSDTPLSPSQIRSVCLHEIGHALGIVGHSPLPDDVMYCSIPSANTKTGITARDTATIQKLYAAGTIVGWFSEND